MPSEICMCSGGNCPQKDTCLRFTATIYGRQDFFGVPPYSLISLECAYYMDERPKQDAIRTKAYQLWQHDGCLEGKDAEYWTRAETYLLESRRG